jgi:endonuclease YncB( thermonuclease family)
MVIGTTIGFWPALSLAASASEPISGCRVTDGDTIRCGEERVRLLGIDAPELPGHYRRGRECAPGDPVASTASLRAGMTGALRIERFGEDRYGRTLALVAGDQGDLSCWQLRRHQVIYVGRWDDGGALAARCPTRAAVSS